MTKYKPDTNDLSTEAVRSFVQAFRDGKLKVELWGLLEYKKSKWTGYSFCRYKPISISKIFKIYFLRGRMIVFINFELYNLFYSHILWVKKSLRIGMPNQSKL